MIRFLLIFIAIYSGFAMAQDGPGGVNTNLDFWFKADQGTSTTTNNARLSTWSDQSGNGRNATASGSARPRYRTSDSNINSMPYINYNGSNQLDMTYSGNSNENMSFGGVMRINTPSNQLDIILQHGGRNTMGFRGSAMSSGSRFTDFVGGSNHHSTNTYSNGNWYLHQKTFANSGSNRLRFYMDGAAEAIHTHTIQNRTGTTHIGGNGSGGGTDFNGRIAEIFKHGKTLNDAERNIVANYLSAKYNLTIPGGSDFYAGDETANGDYDFEVIGIGNETTGTITGSHNLSTNSGGLNIQQSAGFGDGDYLFAGHLDQANSVNQSDISGVAGLDARWERIWYFDVTDAGAGMTVNITFDFGNADVGATTPANASNYKLLYRAGTSGSWTDAGTAGSVVGDEVRFSANALSNGDGYYTLGTLNHSLSPLPIELTFFQADEREIEVDLYWQTASEVNNDFFTIERSRDALSWEGVLTIDGAGNSNDLLNYTAIDHFPYSGVSYYRLKQTDFDGKFSYSEIETVYLLDEISKTELSLYPNPTHGEITLKGIEFGMKECIIFNAYGQIVTNQVDVLERTDHFLRLNTGDLASGLYTIQMEEKSIKFYKM